MSLTFSTVEGPIGEKLDEMFKVKTSFLRVNPGRCLLPPQYVFIAKRIRDLEIHYDDVWIVSYPRTGSHWVQEMVWCIGNDCNFKAAETLIVLRNPLLETSALLATGDYADWFSKLGDSVKYVEQMSNPRYVKTHLPWELLPKQIHEKKAKMIYVTRNPKDTCVSFYHYCRTFHGIESSFEEFAEVFLEDDAPMGPLWSHLLKFWEHRNDENVLFITYEDMKKKQTEIIKMTAKFLNKNLTNEQIEQLKEHLKFSKMAANPAVNLEQFIVPKNGTKDDPNIKFIRKGQIGDWKNYMSKDLERKFDEWIEKHFKGTGFQFDADLSNGVDEK